MNIVLIKSSIINFLIYLLIDQQVTAALISTTQTKTLFYFLPQQVNKSEFSGVVSVR